MSFDTIEQLTIDPNTGQRLLGIADLEARTAGGGTRAAGGSAAVADDGRRLETLRDAPMKAPLPGLWHPGCASPRHHTDGGERHARKPNTAS